MSKYKLSEAVAELRDEHEDIEIETDDGQVFVVPPPELWPDDVVAKADDPVAAARQLLGDQYHDFTRAGGSAMILTAIIRKASGGVGLGESKASTAG